MPNALALPSPSGTLTTAPGFILPAAIADQGEKAAERFFTFFTDNIPNPNTRDAYYRNAMRFFAWTARKRLTLPAIKSYHVSAYLAELTLTGKEQPASAPTVKQHLAALRMLFDWLIIGQVIDANPAAAVRGPKHVVKKGKTPVLTADEARQLLDSIPLKTRQGAEAGAGGQTPALPDRPARPRPDRRHGVQLRPRQRRPGHEGRGLLHRRAGGPGSACTRKAASATRCPPTTTPRRTSTPTSRRQASPGRRKPPSSAPSTATAS